MAILANILVIISAVPFERRYKNHRYPVKHRRPRYKQVSTEWPKIVPQESNKLSRFVKQNPKDKKEISNHLNKSDVYDFVSFGSHIGSDGAFGWHVEFPKT